MYRKLLSVFAAFGLLFGVSACSAQNASVEPLPEDAVIIDVRTPEEYAAGHLEGAELLDLNSAEFTQAIPTLDPETTYVLYCRSGNRSGQAAKALKDAGFAHVIDLGSMGSAEKSTGIPVVKD